MSTGWREVLDGAAHVALVEGDCVEVMRALPDASVDAICCDPPYLLAFMGRDFDSQDGAHADPQKAQAWHAAWCAEALRVLKPGGHLLAFGGTRTHHRLWCAAEDAGFEVRDTLMWIFGSGFPKSADVGKAIDRAAGAERDVVGAYCHPDGRRRPKSERTTGEVYGEHGGPLETPLTAPATDAARQWDGWGTALKPAYEPILLARKPLDGTVAANVIAHGTGAINVDACRVGANAGWSYPNGRGGEGWHGRESLGRNLDAPMQASAGRWPANVLLSHAEGCVRVGTRRVRAGDSVSPSDSAGATWQRPQREVGTHYADADGMEEVADFRCVEGCAVAALDAQAGERTSGAVVTRRTTVAGHEGAVYGAESRGPEPVQWYGDSGAVSRFFPCFYTSKASGDGERWFYCRACKLAGPKSLVTKHARCGLDCADTTCYLDSACLPSQLCGEPRALREKAIGGCSSAAGAESNGWSMCWCGSPCTDLSPQEVASIIVTATNKTTESKTWRYSTRRHTSGCMAAACGVVAGGTNRAADAASGSGSTRRTGTSAARGGRSTGGAGSATSESSARTRPDGGGGQGDGLPRDSAVVLHPT